MAKMLIAYFSRAGENYVSGRIENLAIGNTEIAAKIIQRMTDADIFQIRMVHPYSENYMECIREAKEELETGRLPELADYPADIDAYDTIFLCYPNYWGTMPMPVWTFLKHLDLSGKKIMPLCTNEGSGMGRSEKDLKTLCPNSLIGKGLAVTGGRVTASEREIVEWVKANTL